MCDVYMCDEPYKSLFELLSKTDNVGNCEPLFERLNIEKVEIRGGWYGEKLETLTIEEFLQDIKINKFKDPIRSVKINSNEFKMIIDFY